MSMELITTGGTIDKIYKPTTGELTFDESSLNEMISQGNTVDDISVTHLMAIDSLEMTNVMREQLLDYIKTSTFKKIIVTHGTDTMPETANHLMQAKIDKTIILTGAMIPYRIKNSDALFNLGGAMIAAQLLPIGVYIAMNGKIFDAGNVTKNKTKGIFEPLQ
ncbi:MAG: asparaginase domain-containing protein [Cellvibrionales bacterium]|nr:asparaginase domain-containing protein [Cellvibrionales bacterium]